MLFTQIRLYINYLIRVKKWRCNEIKPKRIELAWIEITVINKLLMDD